jgi:arylsulfatase A-like enzyme
VRAALLPLGLIALTAACGEDRTTGETMEVLEIVRDLMTEPPEWQVEEAHPDKEPAVDVICPAMKHELDGADMLALVLPPPSRVSFTIEEDEAPATLRMRAGVDITARKVFGEQVPEGVFAFEVLLDGESVHRSETIVSYRGPAGTSWMDVGGPDGLAVEPGSVVTLITEARTPAGEVVENGPVAFAGFGGLRLERTRSRPRTRSSPDHPNIVLVVMDTLRADRLSAYGYERPTSPHLERLAERGTLFEEAYATSSWTWPSTASILTGLHPYEHGVMDSTSCFIANELTTLAECLQDVGLTTAAWTANPLVTASRNFAQGFETFEDDLVRFRDGQEFMDDVVAWMGRQAGTRFFLYLHLTEPHLPYHMLPDAQQLLAPDVSEEFNEGVVDVVHRLSFGKGFGEDGRSRLEELVTADEREQIGRLYDACVRSGDHWLGVVLDTLERLELDQETIVVFTSDHGEELFERSYFGHSNNVHKEQVFVPFVMAGPGIPEGRRVRTPVSNRRVAPYLAQRGGARLGGGFDELEFFGPEVLDRPVLFATEKGYWKGQGPVTIQGLRIGADQIHVAPNAGPWGTDGDHPEGDLRVFDLSADPGEQVDLALTDPERAARLRAELERRFAELEPLFESPAHAVGAGTAFLLERIGYAGN